MEANLAVRDTRVRIINLNSKPDPRMPKKNRDIGQWGIITGGYSGLDSDAVTVQLIDALEDPIGDGLAVYYLSELALY